MALGAPPKRHVWVLRHAKAAALLPGGDDHSRPLTKRGRAQAIETRKFLEGARSEGRPVARLVLSSSAARALETAELVLPGLGKGAALFVEDGLYEAEVEEVVERLRCVDDAVLSVMVVGHNPTFSELVQDLADTADEEAHGRLGSFPTCALAGFGFEVAVWAELAEGSGRLEELFVPEV